MKTLHPGMLTRAAAVLFLAALASTSAQARMIISMQEVGANVVVTASGSVNTAGLSFTGEWDANNNGTIIVPGSAAVYFSASGTSGDTYQSVTGPTSFGTPSFAIANSRDGDQFNFIAGTDRTWQLPSSYVSGAPLAADITFTNQTLASLNTTVGTYTWTWGSGTNADSATLYLGEPVPSPEIVNAELVQTSIFGQSYNPSGTCSGFPGECTAGVFSFTATFCNNNASGGILVGLTSRTTILSSHGSLVSRDANGTPVAGGPGSEQDFTSGTLVPAACEDITYNIGLTQAKRFSFYIDVYGNVVPSAP